MNTAAITSTSSRALIEAAYAEINADVGFAFDAVREASAALRAAPYFSPEGAAAMDALATCQILERYLMAEFDRLFAIMSDLPEVAPAVVAAADQFALAL